MADDLGALSDAEKALVIKAREAARGARKVRIFGEHEGTKYEFEVEGAEADAIVSRHRGLFVVDGEGGADDKGKAPRRGILG